MTREFSGSTNADAPQRNAMAGSLSYLLVILIALVSPITFDVATRAETQKTSAVTANVMASIVVEVRSVAPGDTVALLLQQKIRKNCHTYWRNPGDSGQETAVDWSLPRGVRAGAIQWAVPERIRVGTIANYGYTEEVGLIVEISVPTNWPVGMALPVKADAAWLECESVCIPSYATFVLSIPTAPATVLAADVAPMFAAAREALPTPTNWHAAAHSTKDVVTIRIEGLGMRTEGIESAYFFPAEWGAIDHAAEQLFVADERGLTLTVAAGDIYPSPRGLAVSWS